MEKENSLKYFEKGKKLLQEKKLQEAIAYFSQAIAIDKTYIEAYQYRGHVLSKLGRIDEAKEDLRMMKSLQKNSTKEQRPPSPGNIQKTKIDMQSVDNLYDELATNTDDELDFEDHQYDYAFSDDTLDSDSILEGLIVSEAEEPGIPAIIEYVNGHREEIPRAFLFEPTEEELTLIDAPGAEERIILFDQVTCIRLSRPPKGCPKNKDKSCHIEIVETIDGNIYHEAIPQKQPMDKFLFGFSTKGDTHFIYTLIPLVNIQKRFQRRHLGQILLDRELLTDRSLKNALDEHNELKKIKFGKVLAEQANLLQSTVEAEIQKAFARSKTKQKVGDILLRAGLVTEEHIENALKYQKRMHNRKLGSFLIEKGILQEKDVYTALAEKFRIPFVDLRHQKGSKKALALLPEELIKKLNVLPLSAKENKLVIATSRPDPGPICEVILKHSPLKKLEFVLAQPSHLKNVIKVLFQSQK